MRPHPPPPHIPPTSTPSAPSLPEAPKSDRKDVRKPRSRRRGRRAGVGNKGEWRRHPRTRLTTAKRALAENQPSPAVTFHDG
jgi:hypothetical protein